MQRLIAPLRRWGPKILSFGAVQLIVQLLTMVSGFLVIRYLTKGNYAYYTIGNMLAAGLAVLSNSGITSGLMALGGRSVADTSRLGAVLRAGMRLRVYLAGGAVVATCALGIFLLNRNGASWPVTLGMLVVIAVTGWSQVTAAVLRVPLRLLEHITFIQKNDFYGAVLRTVLVLALLGLGFYSPVALLAPAAIAALWISWKLGQDVSRSMGEPGTPTKEDYVFLRGTIRSVMPLSLFYVFQGQITVTLVSIFGNTSTIAEVGALTRVSALLAIIQPIAVNVLIPSFARCQNPGRLLPIYLKALAAITALTIIPVAFVLAFPEFLLRLMGKGYEHLKLELAVAMLGAAFSALAQVMSSLNQSRAWVGKSWLFIPVSVIWISFLAVTLPLDKAIGAVTLNALLPMSAFLVNGWQTVRGFQSETSDPHK